ncbi:GGDEF domain-containing protein [Novosphingobium sp. AP12]|uniref:GGDEF domain-containing protein n=1 Tax=Novosphingobium sp. AP12 TaxID=1144305 RepID=UPI000271E263|nr:GGDEF domain-containing protein [Novosphingobium sp. AP12]EJL29269.1 diguanylate cyclase (GGDEF) domain-containing protein [Novosphingobium sp. AP12]
MAADAQTMLLMTNAIAFVAAAFLFIEWRTLGERFLLSFALGFLSIVVGSSLAPLRQGGSFLVGVWISNSMVPLAHLAFLHGAASFSGRRISRAWFLTPVLCCALMGYAGLDAALGDRDQLMSLFNAGFVAVLSLKAASVLPPASGSGGSETRMLAYTFLFHGSFYTLKALCAFVPGAFVSLSSYAGTMIVVSLFEGVLVAVALAMSIAGALRRRREDRVTRLAESDPLTGLLNRRGFEERLKALYADDQPQDCGALLLIDVDHFKSVNDRFGHQEGDRLLVALAKYLKLRSPAAAIIGRFGGDEFAVVLPRFDEARALDLAHGLCSGFANRMGPENSGTLSIGCAALRGGIEGWPDAHLRADRSLYDAKSEGRNRASLRPVASSAPGELAFFPMAANG